MVSEAKLTATPRKELETLDVYDPFLTILSISSTSNMSLSASTSHSPNIPSTKFHLPI